MAASDLGRLLADLYDSEIGISVSWLWLDDGIHLRIGNPMNGPQDETRVLTLAEAAEWLRERALDLFPESRFTRLTRAPFLR